MPCIQAPTAGLVLLFSAALNAQTLTFRQALDAAVEHHPAARSAVLQAQQQQQLLPAATALADPLLSVESPTGNFYTAGISQSLALPVVYRRQKALQLAQITRAESAVSVVRQEIRYQAARTYREWQYRLTVADLLNGQDSLLQQLAAAAERLFRQGQTDAVTTQYARLEAAAANVRSRKARQDAALAGEQMRLLTGIETPVMPEPAGASLLPLTVVPDSAGWWSSPALQTGRQDVAVAEREVAVAQNRGLPELTLGYLNQGERNSPLQNRFSMGLNVPLWRKRYSAMADAARTGVEAARQNLAAQAMQLRAGYRRASGDAAMAREALDAYTQHALPAARALGDAARRMFENGLSDLTGYLRHRQTALEAELEYWNLLYEALLAETELRYLEGKL